MKLTLGDITEDGFSKADFLVHKTVKGITDLLQGGDVEVISLNENGLEILIWIENRVAIFRDFKLPIVYIRTQDRVKRTAMIESIKRIEKITGKHLWLGDTDN